ncbi:MAG TPA: tRNA pseudouridine(38-40) synthase TruA, partial [Dehalococcoidia bacterium]|nr:tRNA pseudouridine(38-40) synthase TruA [Dehalococcoidia bacterium]
AEVSTRRIALLVEYDGRRYAGSQYQKNGYTIQEALEGAISNLTGESNRVALAGRTDAGVHARGQVASFPTESAHPEDVIVRALNFHLPEDIVVRDAVEVPLTFDVRRQARSRWYRYTIVTGQQRPALQRQYVWHVSRPLDLQRMCAAVASLTGEHDFAAFSGPSSEDRTTVRRVSRAQWSREGRFLHLDMEANAFLNQQVRRTVGALVQVGEGKLSLEGFRSLVEEARPGAADYAAPPQGLCLMRVRYERELFADEEYEDI